MVNTLTHSYAVTKQKQISSNTITPKLLLLTTNEYWVITQ